MVTACGHVPNLINILGFSYVSEMTNNPLKILSEAQGFDRVHTFCSVPAIGTELSVFPGKGRTHCSPSADTAPRCAYISIFSGRHLHCDLTSQSSLSWSLAEIEVSQPLLRAIAEEGGSHTSQTPRSEVQGHIGSWEASSQPCFHVVFINRSKIFWIFSQPEKADSLANFSSPFGLSTCFQS